jgi:hypothetical protein
MQDPGAKIAPRGGKGASWRSSFRAWQRKPVVRAWKPIATGRVMGNCNGPDCRHSRSYFLPLAGTSLGWNNRVIRLRSSLL